VVSATDAAPDGRGRHVALPPGPYLVVGLARSGIAAALMLRARGEEVFALDSGPEDSPALIAAARRLREAGVEVSLGARAAFEGDIARRVRALVKSPGVPREAPLVRAALGAGLTVLGELELAWRLLPNRFIAVTGTNGKTTTTEWIGHILRLAGAPVAVAGNVGTALSSLVGVVADEATIVCECSSFQLEDTLAFAPETAVLLNLTPDHLDRHGTFEDYVAAKLRIFARQSNDDIAVAPLGLGVADLGGCARRVCVGEGPGAELSYAAGQLWWDEQPLLAAQEISLPGAHNRANAMAAAAACLAGGVERDAVVEGLQTFGGVAHRLENVGSIGGVAYVNDSKATNVDSTLVALAAFTGGVHLILGGRGKAQDFTPLADPVADRCRAVYLIGEAADEISEALAGAGVELRRKGDLASAVRAASAAARPGETVLLSPACASYDQFSDFEARGNAFRALARALGLR
jgi:UDP-N-acetylmuramoylalanine--D-glutamate ligase